MIKLLKANFFRLKKEIMFYLFIILTIVVAMFTILTTSSHDMMLNKVLYNYISYIGIFIAMFVSIFVGKEHSEGIIRNKIIVGQSRTSIYISNLIVSIIVSILCEAIYIAIMLIVGNFMYKGLQIKAIQMAMIILNIVLIISAYCSIFNLVAMLCSEITITTIACVIIFIIIYIAEFLTAEKATCTKYITESYVDIDGTVTIINQELNPNYPGDDVVKIAKTIELILPQGQAQKLESSVFTDTDKINSIIFTKEQIAEQEKDLYKMPIFSMALITIINLLGIYLFSKKELK